MLDPGTKERFKRLNLLVSSEIIELLRYNEDDVTTKSHFTRLCSVNEPRLRNIDGTKEL